MRLKVKKLLYNSFSYFLGGDTHKTQNNGGNVLYIYSHH